jgi:hypothetical protein
MGNKGVISQEPIGIKFLEVYTKCQRIFQEVGWFSFFTKFQGITTRLQEHSYRDLMELVLR